MTRASGAVTRAPMVIDDEDPTPLLTPVTPLWQRRDEMRPVADQFIDDVWVCLGLIVHKHRHFTDKPLTLDPRRTIYTVMLDFEAEWRTNRGEDVRKVVKPTTQLLKHLVLLHENAISPVGNIASLDAIFFVARRAQAFLGRDLLSAETVRELIAKRTHHLARIARTNQQPEGQQVEISAS